MDTITKQIKMPRNISEKGFIVVAAIVAVEYIILTAVKQNYSIEIDGEIVGNSINGSMKLQPVQ